MTQTISKPFLECNATVSLPRFQMISHKVKEDSVQPLKEAAFSPIQKTTEVKPTESIESTKDNPIIENYIDKKLDLLQLRLQSLSRKISETRMISLRILMNSK